jgi:hypothetical protein
MTSRPAPACFALPALCAVAGPYDQPYAIVEAPDRSSTRELEPALEGCTRYRIAARRVDSVNWESKVYPEPIAECVKKFRKGG